MNALALLVSLSLGQVTLRDEGSTIGPVTALNCVGSGFACTRSLGVGVLTLSTASASSAGILTSADWTTFNSKLSAASVSSPLTGNGTSGSPLAIPTATGSVNGALSSTDWTTFNGKVASTRSIGTGTAASSGLSGGGDLSADRTLNCDAASATSVGCVTTGTQTFAGAKTFNAAVASGTSLGVGTNTWADSGGAWLSNHSLTIASGSGLNLSGNGSFSWTDSSNPMSLRSARTTAIASPAFDVASTGTVSNGHSLVDIYKGGDSGGLRIFYSSLGGFSLGQRDNASGGSIAANNSVGMSLRWGAAGSEGGMIALDSTGVTLSSPAGAGYPRLNKSVAGAPTGTDCDAAGELGRVIIDTTNHKWCFCEGAAGWKCVTGT